MSGDIPDVEGYIQGSHPVVRREIEALRQQVAQQSEQISRMTKEIEEYTPWRRLQEENKKQAEQLRVAKEALEFVANRKYQTYIDRQVLEALAKLEHSEVYLEGDGT